MIYNGVDLSEYLRVNPARRLAPPVENIYKDIAGANKAVFVRQEIKPLTLEVSAQFKTRAKTCEGMAELRRLLAPLLVTGKPAPLYLPDDPTRYYMAILEDAGELDTLFYTGRAVLRFTAPDPIAYGRELTFSDGERFTVGGTWDTWGDIVTTEPTVHIYDAKTGRRALYIDIPNGTRGKRYEIDTYAQTAKTGGEFVAVNLLSEFNPLKAGRTYKAPQAGSITYKERWL